jgi:hypothetical protein
MSGLGYHKSPINHRSSPLRQNQDPLGQAAVEF